MIHYAEPFIVYSICFLGGGAYIYKNVHGYSLVCIQLS